MGGLPFKKWGINAKLYLFKQNQKTENMKKLFIVLAVAALASCNNGKDENSTATSTTTESTTTTAASTTTETATTVSSATTTDAPSTTATTGK